MFTKCLQDGFFAKFWIFENIWATVYPLYFEFRTLYNKLWKELMYLQLRPFAFVQLLSKPFVNEVYLEGKNLT